ncbi:cyclin-dependent kinase inhibitor 3 [Plakobranchus ocellatus]|uniref:protein-tyrosine-phosphatase n=1 Tax=Plakobranchus ocellatus TaxID=259542 RepID=A0AAV4BBS5_9GAST|nr:cyclin-dependent kinase inhibitor 3 [Plakobranchus ocellatus]
MTDENPAKVDQADLSDVEDAETLDLSPFQVDWLDLEFADCPQKLGICALPGCRFKDTWRSMSHDIGCLKEMKVDDVFCFCTKGELYLCRATKLLEKYSEAGIVCHHYPIEDGLIPEIGDLMKLLDDIRVCLLAGKKTILHCYGGIGRSCAVAACLMMLMDSTLSHEDAKKKLKTLRGDAAIRSVKQYNFVNEFRDLLNNYIQENSKTDSRSVSR